MLISQVFAFLILAKAAGADDEGQIVALWNGANVVLPASQVTPSAAWKANVMVFDSGRRYSDADYNKVWGVPLPDKEDRPWYAADYVLTDGEQSWREQTAPFSSDEYYMGQRSFRWIAVDRTGDLYLRRSFTIDSPIDGDLFLACGHDDAPSEFYINGVCVFSVADGWNNDERVLLTDEQKALIKFDGTENIMAVHVHQNWGGAFADCGLYEADMQLVSPLLSTLDKGEWPCAYYLLNGNDDFSAIAPNDWTGLCIDESDWAFGYGPFSNSRDQFLTTYWGSERQPLLVRRHFFIDEDEMQAIANGLVELTCSYDENPKVYLNGTLIWETNGWNDNDYAHYTLSETQKKLLHQGDNVLAVSLMAGGGGGHIDYGLFAHQPYTPANIGNPIGFNRTYPVGIYDLQGRSVGRLQMKRGVYIVNGKKLIF